MGLTIAKEQLHRIPTATGAALGLGVFLVTFDASYASGGETLDLSGYMKQLIDVKPLSTEDSVGYEFAVDDSNYATGSCKLIALRSASESHSGSAVADHAAHLHNLKFKDAEVADGATTRVNIGADKIGANTGADVTVTSLDGTRGVQNAAAMAHSVTQPSAHAAAALAEVTAAVDLSAVKARCVVWGIV